MWQRRKPPRQPAGSLFTRSVLHRDPFVRVQPGAMPSWRASSRQSAWLGQLLHNSTCTLRRLSFTRSAILTRTLCIAGEAMQLARLDRHRSQPSPLSRRGRRRY